MIRTRKPNLDTTTERKALRRRVKQFYAQFNRESWEQCYALLDPHLRDAGKVTLREYMEGLQAFKVAYRSIKPWYVRISPHLVATSNKHDDRPFAYVYVVWQDAAGGFHMFRERWVRQAGRWYTRVAGLVANGQKAARD